MVETTQTTAPDTKPDTKSTKRQMTFTVMDDGTVRADFPDSGLEPFSFSPASIPESSYPDALTEGVISRLRGFMGKLTGEARTAEALRAALTEGWSKLAAGEWKSVRTPGEGGVSYSIEVEAAFVFRQKRALAAGKDISEAGTLEQAAENFAALTEEQVSKLKANPVYQLARAEVKAARDAAKLAKLAKKAAESEDDSGF